MFRASDLTEQLREVRSSELVKMCGSVGNSEANLLKLSQLTFYEFFKKNKISCNHIEGLVMRIG